MLCVSRPCSDLVSGTQQTKLRPRYFSTAALAAVLGAFAQNEGQLRFSDYAETTGYNANLVATVCRHLRVLGLLVKHCQGCFILTERGKIAYALLQGQAARQAAQRKYKAHAVNVGFVDRWTGRSVLRA